ncbi:hypothetical protein C8R43DRAFT_961275 [Mycena crocata]|nr:hypothetical protein C8R43DRAFT_961275 [Mycena crocata]
MPDITILPANLATLVLESCLYGILVLLFISTVYFLATRRTLAGKNQTPKHHLTSPVFLGVANLFLVVTIVRFFTTGIGLKLILNGTKHWSVVVYQAFHAFITLGNSVAADRFYADLSQPSELFKSVVFYVAVVLGDTLVIHRLWVVWGRRRHIVVFPVITLVGVAVTSVGMLYSMTQWEPKLRGIPFSEKSRPWVMTGFVFSAMTNLYSTGLIAFRIRKFASAKLVSESRLLGILSIFVESAALQTLWLIFTAFTTLTSNFGFIATDNFPVILGISNLLIHARVGLGWASTEASANGRARRKSINGHGEGIV